MKLRRFAVMLVAALFLAHPKLTNAFAAQRLVLAPPSQALDMATPTATAAASTVATRSTPTVTTEPTARPTLSASPSATTTPGATTPMTTPTVSGVVAPLSAAAKAVVALRLPATLAAPARRDQTPTPVNPTVAATATALPPVHPVTPTARPAPVIPAENFYWIGTAQVTMYTCVELGGCNYTASGLWPYEGIVAVDPRLIPLGATVWVDGLGIFLAADTGALIYGNRIDVYVTDYTRATNWGVQERRVAAYSEP